MITKEQYEVALQQKADAENIIHEYAVQKLDAFQARLDSKVPFTDDELIYAAHTLCPCGHGIAYPKDCGVNYHWDCSAILKGIADAGAEHTGKLPFAFYSVISELQEVRARGCTTRGVFKPMEKKP